MKICPNCKTHFPDDLYFCLEDGSALKNYDSFDSAETLAITDMPTFELRNASTGEQHVRTDQPASAPSARRSKKPVVFGGLFVLAILLSAAVAGTFYFRANQTAQSPSSQVVPNGSIDYPLVIRASNAGSENLKVEILGKVKNNSGEEFFKCRLTNVGETIIRPFNVTLMFYKNDVVVDNSTGDVNLEYLKPQQSVPVWVPAAIKEDYTSVKVKEPLTTFGIDPAKQYFLELNVVEAEMRAASSDGYEVKGIIENTNYENVSTELYVFFLDEKSEIIGIAARSFFGLQKEDKVKFDVAIGKDDLFGKPKSFQIFFVAE